MADISIAVSIPQPPQVTVSVCKLGDADSLSPEAMRAYAAPLQGARMRWAADVGAWEYRFEDGWRHKLTFLQNGLPVEGWSDARQ